MAIITKRLGGDGDPAGEHVEFQIDYDDIKFVLTALRCINSSNSAAWGMATMSSNGRSYDMRFPPNTTTEIPIPTGKTQSLDIIITPNGRVDGVEYHFMWPYP